MILKPTDLKNQNSETLSLAKFETSKFRNSLRQPLLRKQGMVLCLLDYRLHLDNESDVGMSYLNECIIPRDQMHMHVPFFSGQEKLIWRWMHSQISHCTYLGNDLLIKIFKLHHGFYNTRPIEAKLHGQCRIDCSRRAQINGFLSIAFVNWQASKPGAFFMHDP